MPEANPGPGYRDYPDYRVELKPLEARVRVEFFGEVVAETARALLVEETRHKPVIYIPRDDVRFECMQENDVTTYCPFKGEARYWNIRVGDSHAGSALWGYDAPYDEVAALSRYVAFYTDRVDAVYVDGKPLD